jgi:hypothetical protein
MSSINNPLLDIILSDSFLESVIYVDGKEMYPKVIGFMSEFLSIVKNLPMDMKSEVSKSLRQSNIGNLSLLFLQGLFTDSEPLNEGLKKDMVLIHLELLYYTFRRDMEFAKETFTRGESAVALLRGLAYFPDFSNFLTFPDLQVCSICFWRYYALKETHTQNHRYHSWVL